MNMDRLIVVPCMFIDVIRAFETTDREKLVNNCQKYGAA